jgi:hypothetical protein
MRSFLEVIKSDSLEETLLKLIGIKDISSQALQCLLNSEIPHYTPYRKIIEGFDQSKFKEEM